MTRALTLIRKLENIVIMCKHMTMIGKTVQVIMTHTLLMNLTHTNLGLKHTSDGEKTLKMSGC